MGLKARWAMAQQRMVWLMAGVAVVAAGAAMAKLAHREPPAAAPVQSVSAPSALTVTVVTPQAAAWPRTLYASGALAAWDEAVIGSEVGGLRVVKLIAEVGDKVTKGQELAQLSQDAALAEVHKQEAEVEVAAASLAVARSDAKRARLLKGGITLSDQQLTNYLLAERRAEASLASVQAQLDAAKVTLANTRILPPDDGVITTRTASLGEVVSTGTEMFRLLRQGRVEWRAELDAQRLAEVRPGMTAHVTLPDGRAVDGTVRVTAPGLNAATGRGLVYVQLPADAAAMPGGFASGDIALGAQPALTVPQAAVTLRDGRAHVFVVGDDNRVNDLVVTTGRRRDGRVEITDGLGADARIVAAGGAFLSGGTTVTVVAAAAAPAEKSFP